VNQRNIVIKSTVFTPSVSLSFPERFQQMQSTIQWEKHSYNHDW